MKKFIKRFFIYLGILILLLIAAAIILPVVYKDKIVQYAKTQANKSLNAKLDFDNDISLSLFKHFPDFSLGVNKIIIINKAPFEGDTLVNIGGFSTTLDLMSVIRGDKIKIKSITLDKPYIHLKVLPDGTSNWDIAIKSKETLKKQGEDTTSNFKMALQKYAINDGKIIYDDKSYNFYLELDSFNHTGQGDFTSDDFDLNTHSTAGAMTVGYGGINYIDKVKTKMDAVFNINLKNSKYTFKNNDIQLNDLDLAFDGYISMLGSDINTDLKFNAKETDFKNILSLVPGIYKNNFKNLQSSGQMSFGGSVKGVYNDKSYPGFNVSFAVKNGMFKYPDLPSAVNNVNIDATVNSPGGPLDNMVADIKKLHLEMGGEPVDAFLQVKTPMSDPYLNAGIKAKISLDKVKNFYQLPTGTTISGLVDADVKMNGSLSAIQNKHYDQFNATGHITAQNVGYSSPDVPQPVKISTMQLDLSPEHFKLSNFNMTIGKSDLEADGVLDNVLGYVLKKQTIQGNLTLNSRLLDINQLMPKSSNTTASAKDTSHSSMSVINIPANIDFTFKSGIGELLYSDYDIKNFNGMITVKDQRLTFNNIGLNMLDATFAIKGYYDSKNAKQPVADFNFSVKNLNIPLAYKKFVTVQKFAPIAQYITGNMNANIALNTSLGTDMMPDMKTLTSNGVLDIPQAEIGGFPPLDALADKLKMPDIKKLTVKGIHPSYYIANGRFYLKEPVEFSAGDAKFSIIGSSGLDKSLDYTMQVEMPAGQLQNQANSIISQALKQKNMQVLSGQSIKANVLIKGTMDKPEISVSLKDLATGTANAIKQKAKEELDKQKKEIQEKAQKEMDQQKQKLQQEANQKIQEEKQKQQQQLQKQADEQKKKLENQAKDKLKDLFKH